MVRIIKHILIKIVLLLEPVNNAVYLNKILRFATLLFAYICIYICFSFFSVHFSVLPLRSVGRSNFDKGLHILTTTLIQNDI